MGRNRKAWREKRKQKRWQETFLYGSPVGTKNEFGKTDLTPFNADITIRGQFATDDFKYSQGVGWIVKTY